MGVEEEEGGGSEVMGNDGVGGWMGEVMISREGERCGGRWLGQMEK